MRRIIICDNDQKIVSELGQLIERVFPEQFQISGYVSSRQLVYEMEDGFLELPDMLFLGVRMKEIDGIETAQHFQKKLPEVKIVFVTESPECAEEIFDDIRPFGLLLRPFRRERLEKYIVRGLEEEGYRGKMVKIKKKGKGYYMPVDEILYVESKGRKLTIHKIGGTESVYEKISGFCDTYQEDFFRCHKGYAVNHRQISKIAPSGIILKNGMVVPISRQKFQGIREKGI